MMPELLASVDGHTQVLRLTSVAGLERMQQTVSEDKKPTEATSAMCLAYYSLHTEKASLEEVRKWADLVCLMVLDSRKPPDPTWPE
jgi:hypothetical protein